MRSLNLLVLVSSLALVTVAACGGDDGDSDTTSDDIAIDAARADGGTDGQTGTDAAIDAAPATRVEEVTCPASPDKTVTTSNFAFVAASVTIPVNGVVKFMLEGAHNVAPEAPTTDVGLSVGFGGTKCLKFTAAATYKYRCTAHSTMHGTVIVE